MVFHPDAESSLFLPDELFMEVLSFSDVKFLMQMRCVCKSWKSLISDPNFVKLHVKRSARNPHLTLYLERYNYEKFSDDYCAVPFHVNRLIENPAVISLPNDPYYRLKDYYCKYVVGSCNGLLCLLSYQSYNRNMWFRLWNPAMRKMSQIFGKFRDRYSGLYSNIKFAFGYDNSSETYKVVMLILDDVKNRTDVQILCMRNNVWKPIQNFPAVLLPFGDTSPGVNDGVYLNGSFNWLALRREFRPGCYDWKNNNVKDFVIVSLDLGTETYTQLMPPRGFDEMSPAEPSISILMDCLCFSNDYQRTGLVIWKMEKFGVEESWTQLIKVSYQNLQSMYRGFGEKKLSKWLPLHLSDNGNTLMLVDNQSLRATLYNLRDNRAVHIGVDYKIQWLSVRAYVESLVSPTF